MEISFEGKRALVTGATRGIGRDIAKQLRLCGAQVVAVGRTKSELESLQLECCGIQIIVADLSKWQEAKDALKEIGPIDLLVNNSGLALLAPLTEITEEEIDCSFDINIKALINVTQSIAKDLIARRAPGAIVNISSQASIAALENHAVYSATKGAVDAFTRVAALELGPHNIRVNAVNPTVIMTDMGRVGWSDSAKADPMRNKIPLKRFGEVREVTDAVLYLLSDKASMVNGVTLPIDGGFLAT